MPHKGYIFNKLCMCMCMCINTMVYVQPGKKESSQYLSYTIVRSPRFPYSTPNYVFSITAEDGKLQKMHIQEDKLLQA